MNRGKAINIESKGFFIRETGTLVLEASATSACRDSAASLPTPIPSLGVMGCAAFENDVIGVEIVDSFGAFLRSCHGEPPSPIIHPKRG